MSLLRWPRCPSYRGRSGYVAIALVCMLALGGCANEEVLDAGEPGTVSVAASAVRGERAAEQTVDGAHVAAERPTTAASLLASDASAAGKAVPQPGAGECTIGQTQINGVDVVRHCGPARGQFSYQGKTVRISQGLCQVSHGAWVMNLGATVVGALSDTQLRAKIRYLGIVVARAEGSPTGGPDLSQVRPSEVVVAFTGAGFADSIRSGQAKLALSADGQSGTFSGPTFGGSEVTGKFDCGQQ